MNPIFTAAAEIQQFCGGRGWRSCIIGGVALQRWGEPRQTLDADLTLVTAFGDEGRYIDALLGAFEPRLPDARDFALKHRVLLLTAANAVPLDVALGGLPFEERSVDRSTVFDVGEGVQLRICSAEDLIIHKVFAGRGQDWVDVRGILVRQTGKLDLGLVREELRPLLDLKGTPEVLERFEDLVREASD